MNRLECGGNKLLVAPDISVLPTKVVIIILLLNRAKPNNITIILPPQRMEKYSALSLDFNDTLTRIYRHTIYYPIAADARGATPGTA